MASVMTTENQTTMATSVEAQHPHGEVGVVVEKKVKDKKYAVIVPVEGRPYIREMPGKEKELKFLQDIVGGYIEKVPHGHYTVHPMFCENPKWDIVRRLLTCKQVVCYGNEDGMRMCSPNFGLVITPKFRFAGVPAHGWGDEVLVVPGKVLSVLGLTIDDLAEEKDGEEGVCEGCEEGGFGDSLQKNEDGDWLCSDCMCEWEEEKDKEAAGEE